MVILHEVIILENTNEGQFERVCEIMDKYGNSEIKLVPILQEIQEVYRYLPEEVMTFVSSSLGISPAKIFGVATFYSHFTLKPKGKYLIKVCDGTACHVKKSTDIKEAIEKKLNLTPENNSTPDLLFTCETVSCLGACGLAPVMVINDEVYGQMNPEKAVEVIEKILAKEVEHNDVSN
jgi:NADH-quinone oxidoreductase subunit E